MCFSTRKLCKLIAEEDIVCYKTATYFVKNSNKWWQFWRKPTTHIELFSIHYKYRYVINELNPEINLVVRKVKDFYEINKGYHSYVYLSNVSLGIAREYPDTYKILKCIIPKGSVYYTNNVHYVSSNLIVTDII